MKPLLFLQIWLLHWNYLLRHQLPGFLVRTQILGSWAQAPVFLRSSPVNPASHNCALVRGRELSSQPGLDEPTMV